MNETAKSAWANRPFSTAARIAATYFLRLHPSLQEARLPYDEGRSVFLADLSTSLGLGMYRYGHHEPELELVGRLLRPGDLFIDGGANVGLFSLVAAARVGKDGKVLSFEPATETRARLARNRAANEYTWIEIRPEALGDREGSANFVAFGGNRSGVSSFAPETEAFGKIEQVRVAPLDSLLPPSERARVRMIKLDLEGAEYRALLGAEAILRESAADVMIEIEPGHLARQNSSAEAVFEFFRARGFVAYQVIGRGRNLSVIQAEAGRRHSPNYFMTRDADRLFKQLRDERLGTS